MDWNSRRAPCRLVRISGHARHRPKPITAEHLLRLRPDVCGHINGGTTSLDDDGVRRLVTGTDMILQLVQAGNLRSALEIIRAARETGQLHQVILASDTPTGTGVMPLGVLKTVCELSSLAGLSPEETWALASGNNARAYGLNTGIIAEGRDADLVVMARCHRPRRHSRDLRHHHRRRGPHAPEPEHADGHPHGHRDPAHAMALRPPLGRVR